MTDANNTEDTARNGRRSTDNPCTEKVLPQATNSLRFKFFSGFLSLGLITALLTVGISVGKYSTTLDTAVKDVEDNRNSIKELLRQNQDLIIVLKEQNIQQKESDKRFEDKFDDANDKLDRINDGVQKNRESIIILQNGKISMRDNTSVIAMR